MKDDIEGKRQASSQLIELHKWIWNAVSYVKDDQARQAAVATIMIQMKNERVFSSPRTEKLDTMPAAYDQEEGRWRYCPKCHTTDIDQMSAGGKGYQACFKDDCRVWLNSDGKAVAMLPLKKGKA